MRVHVVAMLVFALAATASAQDVRVEEAETNDGVFYVLKLRDREIFRTNEVSGMNVHTVFNSFDLALIEETGGTGCPAQYKLLDMQTGKLTGEFGDCSDIPRIIQEAERLTFIFPGYYHLSRTSEPGFKPPLPSTWIYEKGRLRRELKQSPKRRR